MSEPVIDEIHFLISLPIKLSPASTKVSLFNNVAPISFDSFANELTNGISLLVGSNTLGEIASLGRLNINPYNCTILDN